MALVEATLASELEAMVPVNTESEGISNWMTAWENYFGGATVLGIPVTPGSLAGSLSAMQSAMVGINSAGDGGAVIQAAIIAFWDVVIVAAPSIWVTAPLILSMTQPPNLSTIGAALNATFASNISGKLSLENSAAAVAATLHPTQLGAIATITPPQPGVTAPVL